MGRVHVGLGVFAPRSGGRQGWERRGGMGVAPPPPPPPAASERKICNLCHRAAELLASIGELPPPSVSVGGGDTLGMVPG